MRTCHFSRRLIGLLAAYLVALQALILPLSMPAQAAGLGSLCVSAQGSDGTAQHPAGHEQTCPCSAGCGMQCHAPALADTPRSDLPALQWRVAAVLTPAPLSVALRPAIRIAQMPRGPPAA